MKLVGGACTANKILIKEVQVISQKYCGETHLVMDFVIHKTRTLCSLM